MIGSRGSRAAQSRDIAFMGRWLLQIGVMMKNAEFSNKLIFLKYSAVGSDLLRERVEAEMGQESCTVPKIVLISPTL
jgi:hypothetical protein